MKLLRKVVIGTLIGAGGAALAGFVLSFVHPPGPPEPLSALGAAWRAAVTGAIIGFLAGLVWPDDEPLPEKPGTRKPSRG
jgi:hypothetical protein